MQLKLKYPSHLKGEIQLPSSKSISNRSLIIYALTKDSILPDKLAECDDTYAMITALKGTDKQVNIGAAGTAMRFLTSYFAIKPGEKILTGTDRMKKRPIHILVEALKSLGADIQYLENQGYPPLLIRGKTLKGGKIELDGSISSQFISSLLLIAPKLKQGLNLVLKNKIASKPYIDMTLSLMNKYGANAYWVSDSEIQVTTQDYRAKNFSIEPDWSAASYWFQQVALMEKANVTLKNLTLPSLQGDSKGIELFKKLGICYTFQNGSMHIAKTNPTVKKLEADFSKIPDLVQTFAVTACLLNIPFHFIGVETLRIKETDRINALITELRKLGYLLQCNGDNVLYWNGEKTKAIDAPCIDTYEDHRMAMAFAAAAIFTPQLVINNPLVVTKSYPSFWKDLKTVGVKLLKI